MIETLTKLSGLITWQVFVLIVVLIFRGSIIRLLNETAGMMQRARKFSAGKDGMSFEALEEVKKELKQEVKDSQKAAIEAIGNRQEKVGSTNTETGKGSGKKTTMLESMDSQEPTSYSYHQLASLNPQQIDEIMHGNAFVKDDPNKLKWGGKAVVGNRKLTADFNELSLGHYMVTCKVESTQPNVDPLMGEVIFHIDPTFPNPNQVVSVQNGKATLSLLCYGSFTVGAECDNRQTRLELDLAELPDVPQRFRDT